MADSFGGINSNNALTGAGHTYHQHHLDRTAFDNPLEWRHSLEYGSGSPSHPGVAAFASMATEHRAACAPREASASVDVLHDFIQDYWDDDTMNVELLGSPGGAAGSRDPGQVTTPRAMASSSSAVNPTSPTKLLSPTCCSRKPGVVTRAIYASPSSSSAGSETNLAVVVPASKKRVHRKVEVAQLREESKMLEKKLYELREYWKQSSAAAQVAKGSVGEVADPLWKQLAARQKELLSKSELENHGLKAEFQLQKRMARELRKLLVKRAAAIAVSTRGDYSI